MGVPPGGTSLTEASATGAPVEKLLAKAKLGPAAAVSGPVLDPVYARLRELSVSRLVWMAWAEAAWGWAKASKAPLASSTGAPRQGRSWG